MGAIYRSTPNWQARRAVEAGRDLWNGPVLMRLALLFIPLMAAALLAQDPGTPAAQKPGETPSEKPAPAEKSGGVNGSAVGDPNAPAPPHILRPSQYKAPPSNYPTQYLLFVAEAMKSFQARDFPGALSYVEKADAILPPTVWTLNVRGAVAIEQLKFEEGRKFCMEALKLDPNFFPAKFNLSEIPFLQRNYAEARQGWNTLYVRTAPDDPTAELLVYRIFLTFILEDDLVHAKDWLEKLPFPSQTPAYQYSHAVWERKRGNMEKWKDWLESAEFIWPRVKRANFLDVLVQLKWLEQDEFTK